MNGADIAFIITFVACILCVIAAIVLMIVSVVIHCSLYHPVMKVLIGCLIGANVFVALSRILSIFTTVPGFK